MIFGMHTVQWSSHPMLGLREMVCSKQTFAV